jgi:hypothetical protein
LKPSDVEGFVVAPVKQFNTTIEELNMNFGFVVAPVAQFKTTEMELRETH